MKKLTNCKNGGGHLLNKAFTLIELLAVIIILAIIALIATPIILDVVDDARISSGRSEANMILGGINNYCASEDMKYQLDNSYERICRSSMDKDDVPTMVNLGNATIDKIVYNGDKLIELEITSNNHKFTLCPSGTFAMDDEECDEVAVITTGPIKDVVLSNYPYLATNGNGCVTPTANNYSYMGGCYLKGGKSGKDAFYSMMNQMGMDNDTINKTFFDSAGNFKLQEFETWYRNFMKEQGFTDEQIDQTLHESGKNTIFEAVFNMTPEELFAQQALNNNYLWYSGFLWRIMGINADGTVRLITDENVTAIPWGASSTAQNWDDSYAKDWLNEYFYSRLKGNNIIKEETWCSETTTDYDSARATCENNLSTQPAYVGLITIDEYNLAGADSSYLNIGQNQWTMTPDSSSNAWHVYSIGNANNNDVSITNGLRAVINVNSDVTITSGNGTLGETWSSQSGPYILNEDKSVEITGKINEKATSGEYVLFAGRKYRVVDKDSNGNTKLILDGYYEETSGTIYIMSYGSNNTFSTTTGIGQKLNGDVLNWLVQESDIANRNKLVNNYTWYQNNFASGQSYTVSLNEESPTRSIQATVGLIRIGEMLSSQSSSILTKGYTTTSSYGNSATYWTMTPHTSSSYAWDVYNDGNANHNSSVSPTSGLRAVIVVNSDVTITSGNGTWSSPYEI